MKRAADRNPDQPTGGVDVSRSEIISGVSARAQFSAGLVHPVIHFDVDADPTRM